MPKKHTASRVSRRKGLKLEVGKVYVRRDGELTEPLAQCSYGFYDAKHGTNYRPTGKPFLANKNQEYKADLVSIATRLSDDGLARVLTDVMAPELLLRIPSNLQKADCQDLLHNIAQSQLKTITAVCIELCAAQASFPPFNSLHEGFSVLKEEVDELWDVVKTKQGRADRPVKAKAEAVQVAAMALRLILDCCEPGSNGYGK